MRRPSGVVLESKAGGAWIVGIADARAFLREQHPPAAPLRIAISQRTVTVDQLREAGNTASLTN